MNLIQITKKLNDKIFSEKFVENIKQKDIGKISLFLSILISLCNIFFNKKVVKNFTFDDPVICMSLISIMALYIPIYDLITYILNSKFNKNFEYGKFYVGDSNIQCDTKGNFLAHVGIIVTVLLFTFFLPSR